MIVQTSLKKLRETKEIINRLFPSITIINKIYKYLDETNYKYQICAIYCQTFNNSKEYMVYTEEDIEDFERNGLVDEVSFLRTGGEIRVEGTGNNTCFIRWVIPCSSVIYNF